MALDARVEQVVRSPEFQSQNTATQKAALGALLPGFSNQTPETQQVALDGILTKYKPPSLMDELGQGFQSFAKSDVGQGIQNFAGETAEGLSAGLYRYNNTPQELQAAQQQGGIANFGSTAGQILGDIGGQTILTLAGGALGGLAGAGAGALPGAVAGSAGYRGLRETNAQLDRGGPLNPLTIGQQTLSGGLDAVIPGAAVGGLARRAVAGAAINAVTDLGDTALYNALEQNPQNQRQINPLASGGFGAVAGALLGKRPVAKQAQPIGLNKLRAAAAKLPEAQPQDLSTSPTIPRQNRRPIQDFAQYAREPQYRKEVNAKIFKQGERVPEDAPPAFEDRLDPLGEDQYVANEARRFMESLRQLDEAPPEDGSGPQRKKSRIAAQKKIIDDDEYTRQFNPDAPKSTEVQIAERILAELNKPENPLVKRALQNKAKPTETRKSQMESAKKERTGNRLLEAIASATKKKEPTSTKTEIKRSGPDEYARMAKQAKEETAALQKKAAKANPLEVVREKAKADRQVEDAKPDQILKASAEKESPPPAPVKKAGIAKPEPTPEPPVKPKTDDGTQPFDNPANLKAKPQDDALVGEGGIVMTFEDLKKDPKAAAKLARLDAGARGVASTWKAQAKAGKQLEMFGYDPVTGEISLSSEHQGIKTGRAGTDGSADKTVTPLGMAHNADNDNLYLVGYNNNFELRTYILPEKLGDKGVSVVRPIDTPGLVGETPNPYFNAGEFADPRDYVLKMFNELPKTSIDALVRSDGKIPPQISSQIREYLVNRGDDRYEVFNFVRETMGQKEKLLAAIMDADPAIAKAVSHLASGGQTSLLKAGAEIEKASPRVQALLEEVTLCVRK
jgi:hypothetical protein